MIDPNNNIYIYPDAARLNQQVAKRILQVSKACIKERGRFHLALSGGSTPKRLFELLATPNYVRLMDWRHAQIWFGDERCVPPDHPNSNFHMTHEALLKHVPVADERLHRIRGELAPAEAADEYEKEINACFGDKEHLCPRLDLLLLGLGEDGHTASLFPGTAALGVTDRCATEVYVEKLDAWRITLTLPMINAARHIAFVVAGEGKAEIVRELQGSEKSGSFPAGRVRPAASPEWHLDKEAAALISNSLLA